MLLNAEQPIVEHGERFEVVTSPDGSSTLHLRVACATPLEHYRRTTKNKKSTSQAVDEADANVCSTGLRVYEGAQVLSAFLCQYGLALSPLTLPRGTVSTEAMSSDNQRRAPHLEQPTPEREQARLVVELGCGCGLAGFTASTLFLDPEGAANSVTTVFTDGSEECLRLVRRTGQWNHLPVADGCSADTESAVASPRVTFPLVWSEDGVQTLRKEFKRVFARAPKVSLVLGSDIMYYRVDVRALMATVKRLLLEGDLSQDSSGFCVLSHVMRIPDGRKELALQARSLGFGLAKVPVEAFLSKQVILERGWGDLETVILYLKSEDASRRQTSTGRKATRARNEAEEEASQAVSEVVELRGLLLRRVEEQRCKCLSAASWLWRAVQQTEGLGAILQPYVYRSAATEVSGEGYPAAEEDFLHTLL